MRLRTILAAMCLLTFVSAELFAQARVGGTTGGIGGAGIGTTGGFGTGLGGGLGTGLGGLGSGLGTGLGGLGGGLGTGLGGLGGFAPGTTLGGTGLRPLGQSTGFRPGSTGLSLTGSRQAGSRFDPFAATRANPLAQGMQGRTGTGTVGGSGRALTQFANQGGFAGNLQSNPLLTGGIMGTVFGMGALGMSGRTAARTASALVTRPFYVLQPDSPAPDVSQQPPDQATERVLRAVQAAPNLRDSKLQVAIEGNVVVLRGVVGSDHDKALAEALLRLEPGVYHVRNELQVQTPSTSQ